MIWAFLAVMAFLALTIAEQVRWTRRLNSAPNPVHKVKPVAGEVYIFTGTVPTEAELVRLTEVFAPARIVWLPMNATIERRTR